MTCFAIHLFSAINTIATTKYYNSSLVLIPIYHLLGEIYEGGQKRTLGHWTLVAVDMQKWAIMHFDSLPGAGQRAAGVLDKIIRFLVWEAEVEKQDSIGVLSCQCL